MGKGKAKQTPKSPPPIVDSDQLGCMFGFSSIFHFHHGHGHGTPTQNLLLNHTHLNNTLTGAEQNRSTAIILTGFDQNCQRITKKHKKAKKDSRIIVNQSPSQATSSELSSHDEGFCNQIPLKNGLKSTRRKDYQLGKNSLQIVHTFIDQMEVGKQTREKSLWKRIMNSRYGYPKKRKEILLPSKSLEIMKPSLETMQNLRKEIVEKYSAATNRKNKKSELFDLCESSSTKPNLPIVAYSKKRESDVSLEAKKHLSERLRRVETVEAVLSKQSPRTLEKVLLSSPKHDLAATLSSKWEINYNSASTQMRFSPSGNSHLTHEKSLQTRKDNNPFKLDDSFMTDASSSTGCLEIQGISAEQNITDATATAMLEGNQCSEGLILESPSSSTVNICKLQITNKDQEKEENPSPLSILEPFFKDDASSPMSSITESPERLMQPLHLDFDEHLEISFSMDVKDKEIISAYIKKVYQSSQLDWDKFLADGGPAKYCCEQKLLYDCIKEVLIDLHQCYFGSFIHRGIQAVSMEENAANEVMKEIDWFTVPRTMPFTLDQLVEKDIAKSRKWVDITVDTEDIVIEIVEEALEASVLELILDLRCNYGRPVKKL